MTYVLRPSRMRRCFSTRSGLTKGRNASMAPANRLAGAETIVPMWMTSYAATGGGLWIRPYAFIASRTSCSRTTGQWLLSLNSPPAALGSAIELNRTKKRRDGAAMAIPGVRASMPAIYRREGKARFIDKKVKYIGVYKGWRFREDEMPAG